MPLPRDLDHGPSHETLAEHATAREQLDQRTRELEAVFEALPDLYFRLDADGKILERRAGRSATVRFREEEILGRRLVELLPPSVRPGFDAAFADARRTGQLVCVEYPVETEDGHKEFEARFA